MTLYLGIDPGLSGGISLFDPSDWSLESIDMPTAAGRKVKKAARKQTDYNGLAAVLQLPPGVVVKALLENVWSQPNDGAIQAHNFGLNVGAIRGVLATYDLEPELILPTTWKKHFGLIGTEKKASVEKAFEKFPNSIDVLTGPRGGAKDGRCEASLIALYAYERPQP